MGIIKTIIEKKELDAMINLILSNSYALVRIFMLRFVIPYASTKVNNYAMKLYPTCGALFGVNYA